MEKKPLVSIACGTYNQEKYIAQTIEGFLMQKTSFDFEIIVHDDASTDRTKEIVMSYTKKYPDKFNNIYQNENQLSKDTSSVSRIMFSHAKGKYIALCEGDDYWTDPYKLQKQVDFLESNEEYVACFHKVKILEKSGDLVDDYITIVPNKHETIEDLARDGNYIHTPSVIFRNAIKKFPEAFFISPIGDYFMYMLLAEHGKFKYLTDTMAVYRNGVGMHSSKKQQDKENSFNITLFLIWHIFIKSNITISTIIFGRIREKLEQILNNKALIEQVVKINNDEVNLTLNLCKQLEYSYQIDLALANEHTLKNFHKSASLLYLFKLLIYKLGFTNFYKKLRVARFSKKF